MERGPSPTLTSGPRLFGWARMSCTTTRMDGVGSFLARTRRRIQMVWWDPSVIGTSPAFLGTIVYVPCSTCSFNHFFSETRSLINIFIIVSENLFTPVLLRLFARQGHVRLPCQPFRCHVTVLRAQRSNGPVPWTADAHVVAERSRRLGPRRCPVAAYWWRGAPLAIRRGESELTERPRCGRGATAPPPSGHTNILVLR